LKTAVQRLLLDLRETQVLIAGIRVVMFLNLPDANDASFFVGFCAKIP
jgi:hypothetical protein